jgi:hypothetical protein
MGILGYFDDDNKQPIAFVKQNGLVVFSNDVKIKENNRLGGTKELHKVLSNVSYYVRRENPNRGQNGGGGLFGESQGKCGWGDSPNCCFYDCAPTWRTQLWPFDAML